MHMADALLAPSVAAVMCAGSVITAGYSVKKIRLEDNPVKIPEMGVMGAFVFAAQMINFTIPGTGSSGHLTGGMLLSALLGPYAGFISMIGVLLIQCLFFADGGIMALGANIWNMAFYGCFVGGGIIWKIAMKNGASKKKICAAGILGCVVSMQLGAFSVTVETLASGITELPFTAFLAAMQPIHLAIGLVEGIITSAVLIFVYEAQPKLIWGINDKNDNGRTPVKKVFAVTGICTVIIAGAVSLAASALPDGLEWSVARVADDAEITAAGGIYDVLSEIQNKLAVMPDYAFKHSDTAAGTSVSGIAGAAIVFTVCILCCYLFRLFRKRRNHEKA